MILQFLKSNRGFSLVEMLVSVSILLLVIVGPMTILAKTSKSTTYATEQVQAFFLAQEGLELVQKYRDDQLLSHFVTPATPWATFTPTSGYFALCYGSVGCGLGWGSTAGSLAIPVDCSTIANCLLYRGGTGRSQFTHTNNGITPVYTRVIKLTKEPAVSPNSVKSVKVVSTVTWRTGTLVASQRVIAETYLYNIYNAP